MQATLTETLADFILAQSFANLPHQLTHMAKRCIIDGLGVMLAGSRTEPASIVRTYLRENMAPGRARVLGSDISAKAQFAALANGVSGHAMDFDDTQLSYFSDRVYGLLTHPTVPALSSSLAVAQEVECTAKDMLAAFCTGFEVECKVAEAINPDHYKKGLHSTGTIGVFGAAAAASRLLGLSQAQTRHALGIAASKSAGLRVNFGTMTKPYHAGAAAENGVTAAKLARLGYRADPSALDGPWGFFQVTGGGCDPQVIRHSLGDPWSMLDPGISVKPYPCGSLAHPSMDAMLELVMEHDLRPEQVREVRLGTSSNVLNALRYQDPQNELEAKFSIPFCMSILLLERKAGIRQFTEQVVNRPDVRQLMPRVKSYLHEGIEARGFHRIRSLVEIELEDGRILSREADTSRGTPQRPMSDHELSNKFRECGRGVLGPSEVETALEALWDLENAGNIGALSEILS